MAKKNTYYFTHDINARMDERLLYVRMRMGAEGYGIFFMIVEMLAAAEDHTLVKDYNIIAFDLRCSSEKVKNIVEDFGLFECTDDGKRFYSCSLNRRMESLDNLRDQRSAAGKASAEARKKDNSTSVQRSLNKTATTVDQKRNKREEIKEEEKKEEYNPPTPQGGIVAGATTVEGEKKEKTNREVFLEVWKDCYKKIMHTDYIPNWTRNSTDADSLCAKLEAKQKEFPQYTYRQFVEAFVMNAYDVATEWEREQFGLSMVADRFNEIYARIINPNTNSNGKSTANNRKASGPQYSQKFLRDLADGMRE